MYKTITKYLGLMLMCFHNLRYNGEHGVQSEGRGGLAHAEQVRRHHGHVSAARQENSHGIFLVHTLWGCMSCDENICES